MRFTEPMPTSDLKPTWLVHDPSNAPDQKRARGMAHDKELMPPSSASGCWIASLTHYGIMYLKDKYRTSLFLKSFSIACMFACACIFLSSSTFSRSGPKPVRCGDLAQIPIWRLSSIALVINSLIASFGSNRYAASSRAVIILPYAFLNSPSPWPLSC